MPDLTGGYLGGGRGATGVLDAILARPGITWKSPAYTLAQELFTKNFMPYAKGHWAYDATRCNCEDLARALWALWNYVGHKRKGLGPPEVLPTADVQTCGNGGMITKPWRVFAGPAQGNVRNPATNALDGRCLFPVHYVCKVGSQYFDPTFDRQTAMKDDCIQRRIDKLGPTLWLSEDGKFLYERNQIPATGFADSWNELSADDWVTHAQWKELTARSGHWRSSDLKAVDQALESFEGTRSPGNLNQLRAAFQQWYSRNPAEVGHRNRDSCINRLALNLGLAKALLKTG